MKFIVEKSALVSALAHIQYVIERRNVIPILNNVLLEAQDDTLALSANSMDMFLCEKTQLKTLEQGGAITVPAGLLFDIVRKLQDGADIQFDVAESIVKITSGQSKFSLQTMPAEDFPAWEQVTYSHTFSPSAEALRTMIDKTRFAIAQDITRYYLNGVYLHVNTDDGSVLHSVATDGHRLALVKQPCPDTLADMPGIIVPRKAIFELRKLLEGAEGDVEISIAPSAMQVTIGSTTLATKLIEGTYPNYMRVIPTNNERSITVSCETFADAVDRVATITTDKVQVVKISLDTNAITLTASNQSTGEAEETLQANYSHDPMQIGFNARYLTDIVRQIEEGELRIDLADESAPCVIHDHTCEGVIYVLMPMRI